jgi:predicted nucleic acid-binding protein
MKIYFDVCCLNRPFDDQSQDRIRLESEAILLIMGHVENGEWDWLSSDVVIYEIEQIPDPARKQYVSILASFAREVIPLENQDIERSNQLVSLGFHTYDAYHLACAEKAKIDTFLTTDDRLRQLAWKHRKQLQVKVANPLTWLEEEKQK